MEVIKLRLLKFLNRKILSIKMLPLDLRKLIISYLPLNQIFDTVINSNFLKICYDSISDAEKDTKLLNAILPNKAFNYKYKIRLYTIDYDNNNNIITSQNILYLVMYIANIYDNEQGIKDINTLLFEIKSPVAIILLNNKMVITKIDLVSSLHRNLHSQ
jgi:hypothetical protein